MIARPLALAAVFRPAPQRGVRVRHTTLCRRGVAVACFAVPKKPQVTEIGSSTRWKTLLVAGPTHLIPSIGVKARE